MFTMTPFSVSVSVSKPYEGGCVRVVGVLREVDASLHVSLLDLHCRTVKWSLNGRRPGERCI